MYLLTDAADEKYLADAATIADARFSARTMHDEGEPLPILIQLLDDEDAPPRVVESLVEGPFGAMIQGSDLSRRLR